MRGVRVKLEREGKKEQRENCRGGTFWWRSMVGSGFGKLAHEAPRVAVIYPTFSVKLRLL